jgi:putative membrane protein
MRAMATVDSRLLQANERTLLAWVRTSIALMTFGFVIARIGVWLRAFGASAEVVTHHELGTAWIGGVFVAMGVIGNALAVRRFTVSRRAIRRQQEIPDDPLPVVFAVLVSAFGAIIGGYLLLRLL